MSFVSLIESKSGFCCSCRSIRRKSFASFTGSTWRRHLLTCESP